MIRRCAKFNSDEYSHLFTGAMDEIRIYVGPALTAAQVASIMTSDSVTKSEYGLVLSLSFDGHLVTGAGMDPLLDSSCGGSNNAVTKQGGVWTIKGKICSALSVDKAANLNDVAKACPQP